MTLAELMKCTGVKVEKIDNDNYKIIISAVAAKQKYQRGRHRWALIIKDIFIAEGKDIRDLIKNLFTRIEVDFNIRYNIKKKRKRKVKK